MECLGLTMLNCGLQNVKLMLHVLNTKRGGGGHEETFGSDENVYYLDCDDGFRISTCADSLTLIH